MVADGASRGGLPPPQGRQADVAFMDPEGPLVVLGTAGSGKSVMAIHRAAFLSNPETDHGGRTLLVTFNKVLVGYLNGWANGMLGRVEVDNFSSWARTVVVEAGDLRGWTRFAQLQDRSRVVAAAVEDAQRRVGNVAVLRRPIRFFEDEFDWIAGTGITDQASYQESERIGRGGGVNRGEQRAAVWAAFELYRRRLLADGFDDDWHGLTNRAFDVVTSGRTTTSYRHVVVDEAQDLSPQALRALAGLVQAEGSITLFADYAQQLYGSRRSWTEVGIPRPRVEEFRQNYRNSTAIARFAIAMAGQGFFRDTEDLVEPTARVVPGDRPALVDCSALDERRWVAERARQFSATQQVGIVVPAHADIRAFRELLGSDAEVVLGARGTWRDGPGITITTMHSAKGLEFGTVFLPHAAADRLPLPDEVDAFGEEEARRRAARMIYVGITRARSNLILTHSGPVTDLLPPQTRELALSRTATA